MRRIGRCAACLSIGVLALNLGAQTEGKADLVLVNGKIITVDAVDSVAEALAIRDGKILEVGKKASVMKQAGPATRVVDLHGLTATPGLIDSHLHFASVEPVYAIDLSTLKSVSEVVAAVKERVAEAKAGEWIRGHGWDEGKLTEKRYILAADLDKVSPNNPVWLTHTTGHYGVANSLALRLAHVNAETKSPPAGTIDKDAAGMLTGVLKEEAAMGLVRGLIPKYSHDQMRAGYLSLMAGFNKEGITAIKDPGIAEENWSVYRELLQDKKLSIHLFALWSGGTTMAQTQAVVDRILEIRRRPTTDDSLLISGGVKLFMDGSGGARTAWMTEDWNKNFKEIDSGNRGYPLTDPEVYRQQVRTIHAAGLHIGTHAIGDRAINWVVDTYAQALRDKPTSGLRHSIIHANVPSDHAIDTMAALQKQYDAGYPEAQAEFMYWIGDTYAANFGPQRCLRLMPFHTYLQRGIIWAGGSDFSVTPFPARLGLWSSVARETLNGVWGKQPFGTVESVNIHDALRSYTIWSAHQLFLEKHIGSLEVGKDADIAVWDRDIYSAPAHEIKDMKCKMTLLRGRIIYQAAANF